MTAPTADRDEAVASPPLAVRTTDLTRSFGRAVAVNRVDLAVPSGEVYGFLGPNGSGKTTTIRLLLGLLNADTGSVDVLGEPVRPGGASVLHRVGALVEGPAFYPYLTGEQNLRRFDAADSGADRRTSATRIASAFDRVGLSAAARKRYRAYSLGMKQRLGIAAALLQPRDLLILDEPTNGLDPQGTREVRRLIRELADDGTTVLVSSHLLSEIQQVATHVGIMSAGRLIRQGPLREVLGTASVLRVTTPDIGAAQTVLAALGLAPTVAGEVLSATLDGQPPPEEIARRLVTAAVRLRGFVVDHANLEDMFVELTGEGFDVAG